MGGTGKHFTWLWLTKYLELMGEMMERSGMLVLNVSHFAKMSSHCSQITSNRKFHLYSITVEHLTWCTFILFWAIIVAQGACFSYINSTNPEGQCSHKKLLYLHGVLVYKVQSWNMYPQKDYINKLDSFNSQWKKSTKDKQKQPKMHTFLISPEREKSTS